MENEKSDHISQQCVPETINVGDQRSYRRHQATLSAQHSYVIQEPEDLNVCRASMEALSLHPIEPTLSTPEAHQQHVFAQDFVHIFPTEIACAIFESIAFYDFVSCTNVSPLWRVFLMRFVWPQEQEYFLSLYPLFPLSQQERTEVISWLQGHSFSREYYPSNAFSRLKSRLEHNHYLQHRHNPEYVTYLRGKSYQVMLAIEERIATIETLVLGSTISPASTSDLFRLLSSCSQLKRLKFESNLIVLPLTSFSKHPKLSITYLNINRLQTLAHTSASHIDVLMDILMLCPLLRELILNDQNYWDGSIHRILQLCPSTLSTITLEPYIFISRQIVSYIPTAYVPSIQKLSIDLFYSNSNWGDLHDIIASTTETLEVLCVVFPNSGEPPTIAQHQTIIKMARTFRRCHRLHTTDIKFGSMTNEILKAMSELPSLVCIHFSLPISATSGELHSFFMATNAQIQKIYLYDFYHIIDGNILSAISRFPSLQVLKITAFPFPGPLPKNLYIDSIVEQVMIRNSKLKVIHKDSVDGIHLEVQATDD